MAITRTVFITGGARRIGMAVAKYLHASGYNIIITYNNWIRHMIQSYTSGSSSLSSSSSKSSLSSSSITSFKFSFD